MLIVLHCENCQARGLLPVEITLPCYYAHEVTKDAGRTWKQVKSEHKRTYFFCNRECAVSWLAAWEQETVGTGRSGR
jgi:hypothetical protein